MTFVAAADGFAATTRARSQALGRAFMAGALDKVVFVWILMGGLVMIEPSPYEFMFVVVLPIAFLGGLKVYRTVSPLAFLLIAFVPFALAAAFQVVETPYTKAVVYEFITIFMFATAFFAANYVAEKPQERLRRIMLAFTIIAVFSSLLGTAGYLGLIPGAHDMLTRASRAKALFKDPNVFGPFLIPPAIFATQRMFLGDRKMVLRNALIVLSLVVGIFVSFSRAAWGNLLGSSVLLFVLVFALEANPREKVRMIVIGMVGVAITLAILGALLSIPAVGALFQERFAVEQYYDSGENGRFGRQGFAYDVGLSNPLGIGPGEFVNTKINEEAHDTYATTLHVYGWGGALMWDAMLVLTLVRIGTALFRRSPNRRLLIPLVAVYIPLVVQAGIIDIDHWRHYYLIVGLIWGVTAGYYRLQPGESRATALV